MQHLTPFLWTWRSCRNWIPVNVEDESTTTSGGEGVTRTREIHTAGVAVPRSSYSPLPAGVAAWICSGARIALWAGFGANVRVLDNSFSDLDRIRVPPNREDRDTDTYLNSGRKFAGRTADGAAGGYWYRSAAPYPG